MKSIDVFIPVKNDPDYLDFLPICLGGVLKNVQHTIGTIHLLSHCPIELPKLPRGANYRLIQEPEYEEKISDHMHTNWHHSEAYTNPWLRQQIFKLYSFLESPADHILVVDADLLFLNPIRFLDDAGKFIFYMENEFYKPYFRTIESLLGMQKATPQSFISDHLLFHAPTLKEMLAEVESRAKLPFTEAVAIELLKSNDAIPALSEYEMYGTFLLNRKPDTVAAIVPNPNTGVPHLFLPRPEEWTYESLRAKIDHPHYFLPKMPSHRRPADYPALTIESIDNPSST